MDIFTVKPRAERSVGERSRPRMLVAAWIAASLYVLVALAWFWLISVPGSWLPTLVPFVGVLLAGFLIAAWHLLQWAIERRAGRTLTTPWPAMLVLVVALVAVVGTRYDVSARLRFETMRDELTEIAGRPTTPARQSNGDVNPTYVQIPGHGSATVTEVDGGVMVETGGHPMAMGFVYLPDPDDASTWDDPDLRPLGGGWYLTT
jgi:protein-S-isoprenylcysteine O-methyltransferase Ste14